MRKIYFLAFILLASVFTANAQATEKLLTKSFNADGKKLLRLELPGTTTVKTWDNATVRIEILVTIADGINQATLDELANAGRYNVNATPSTDGLLFTAANLHKQIRIKGLPLNENVTFTVFVPQTCKVENASDITASIKL